MTELLYGGALELARERLLDPDAYLPPAQASFDLLQLSQIPISFVAGYKPNEFYMNSSNRETHVKRLAKLGSIAIAPGMVIFGHFPDGDNLCAVPWVLDAQEVRDRVVMGISDSIGHNTVSAYSSELRTMEPVMGMKDAERGYSIMYNGTLTYSIEDRSETLTDEHKRSLAAMARAIPEVRFVTRCRNPLSYRDVIT